MELCGWGRYPRIEAEMTLPATRPEASAAVTASGSHTVIPRGLGRSYGDSSLAPRVIGTSRLNLMLDFDAASGHLRCSAGASLADVLEVFVPRGWFLPVTPGTRFVSVGGAIASDVHGKNHHLEGCFSQHVVELDLMLADGRVVTCSRSRHPDLFHATCGGMGLTGLILEATIRLRPIRSAYINQTTLKAENLQQVLEFFEMHRRSTYSVAWIDCQATGASLGRSLLMLGEHADDGDLTVNRRPSLSVPCDMPSPLMNRYSIGAFNFLYYHRTRARQTASRVHYEPFFYPLDGLRNWNRLYGRRGFVQYQFVIPTAAGPQGVGGILKKISESRSGSFLSVLKVFGRENENPLSFPLEGYTLALDFRIGAGLFDLLNELDAMVIDHGGRLYLTKDSRMSESVFKSGYPRWKEFQDVREKYGLRAKFSSCQSQRLGL